MMKMRIKLRVLLSVLCISLVLVTGVVSAQETVSPALDIQLDSLESYVAELRGLEALTLVDRRFPSREEVLAYLEESFNTQLNEEMARRYVAFYAAFDLLPADTDLRQVYLELLGSQVGGYYDPDTKQMNTLLISGDGELGDELPLTEQIIYVHEYTHAIQDQHFGLREIGFTAEESDANPDKTLAIQALIEGDATFVMNVYTQAVITERPMAAFEVLMQGAMAGSLFLPPDTPAILATELLYPYTEGEQFVRALYQQGGYAAVDAAFASPPQSTEQILHPEKYFAQEMPVSLEIAPLSSALGEGWTQIWDRTLGEFYLIQVLDTNLTTTESRTAAAGWGGDRYQIYQNAEGQLAWVLRIQWDTPEEAAEFNSLYSQWLDTRYPQSASGEQCRDVMGAADAICAGALDNLTSLIAFAPDAGLARALYTTQQP